ncbi:hypothetical protein K439DRAFT_1621401 [Ramaria rubella]|nr:hypothetical protein K439DRAFT_1621401 [Ramaria rubella]
MPFLFLLTHPHPIPPRFTQLHLHESVVSSVCTRSATSSTAQYHDSRRTIAPSARFSLHILPTAVCSQLSFQVRLSNPILNPKPSLTLHSTFLILNTLYEEHVGRRNREPHWHHFVLDVPPFAGSAAYVSTSSTSTFPSTFTSANIRLYPYFQRKARFSHYDFCLHRHPRGERKEERERPRRHNARHEPLWYDGAYVAKLPPSIPAQPIFARTTSTTTLPLPNPTLYDAPFPTPPALRFSSDSDIAAVVGPGVVGGHCDAC